MPSLQFKGKSAVWNHHLSVPYHTLEQDKKKSLKGKNDAENLIIQGDNLLALKALLPQYQGKVKFIYIDPPYNTGNEGWVYSDNVSSPTIKEWVGKVVGKAGEDLTRHDKWLCMMTPRLKLLRELLAEDGVIFISIDDNEVHHLRCLMNEIFIDPKNVEEMIWKKVEPDSGKMKITYRFRTEHEYVLVGYKNKEQTHFTKYLSERNYKNEYTNPDNDPRGAYKQGIISATEEKSKKDGKNYYTITTPSGKKYSRQWRVSEEEMGELIADERIYFGKKGDAVPSLKVFINEPGKTTPMSILEGFGTAKSAGRELEELFDGTKVFNYPKPVDLVEHLMRISTNEGDLILDSFAGSGTTAHAVLDLNKEDGGNRKFILVEMEDYADKITAERVRRAIKKNGYDAGFTYHTLGQAIDAESLLTGKLPSYKEFAKYVYYLATGKNHPDESKIKETESFVGKGDGESVYLLYKKDMEALKSFAITLDWAQETSKKDKGKKIVYAPACYLDDETLDQYNITFVSVPYNLFEKAA
jgi:adenine-specific DNA-methyltransferase